VERNFRSNRCPDRETKKRIQKATKKNKMPKLIRSAGAGLTPQRLGRPSPEQSEKLTQLNASAVNTGNKRPSAKGRGNKHVWKKVFAS